VLENKSSQKEASVYRVLNPQSSNSLYFLKKFKAGSNKRPTQVSVTNKHRRATTEYLRAVVKGHRIFLIEDVGGQR
jgi:transposase